MRVEYYFNNRDWGTWAHNLPEEESLIVNILDPYPNECVMIVPNTCQEELD